ncbi:MAG: P-loop NTPase [Pirellulaceae bacterium]|nr:P-loop NTPase [Pirellulaceae bacterium]
MTSQPHAAITIESIAVGHAWPTKPIMASTPSVEIAPTLSIAETSPTPRTQQSELVTTNTVVVASELPTAINKSTLPFEASEETIGLPTSEPPASSLDLSAEEKYQTTEFTAQQTPLELPNTTATLPPTEENVPTPSSPSFSAVWEVDAFDWPPLFSQLHHADPRNLNDAVQQLHHASQEGLRVLGVTSCQAGEGRTTVAACLARAMANTGLRVALVDANLQQPGLSETLGIDAPTSWLDTILTKIPLNEVAVRSLADGLILFPITKHAELETSHIPAHDMNQMLQVMSRSFDLVIIDLECAAMLRQRAQDASTCPLDACILVRDVRITSEECVVTTINDLHECGIESVSIIENFSNSPTLAKAS